MSSISYLSLICSRVRRHQSEHESLASISTYPSNATTNTGPTRTLRRLSSSPPGNHRRCRSTCRSSNCFRFTPLRCERSYVYSFLYTGTLVRCPHRRLLTVFDQQVEGPTRLCGTAMGAKHLGPTGLSAQQMGRLRPRSS